MADDSGGGPEGELFSFCVVNEKKNTVLSWSLTDVLPSTTFADVIEQLSERIGSDTLAKFDVMKTKCVLDRSSNTPDNQVTAAPLSLRVSRCAGFTYATFRLAPSETVQQHPVRNAFSAMMAPTAAASLSSRPTAHVQSSDDRPLRGDLRLENDIIAMLHENGLGFRRGVEETGRENSSLQCASCVV